MTRSLVKLGKRNPEDIKITEVTWIKDTLGYELE